MLPARERRMVGPFIFLDHAGPVQFDPGQGATFGRIRISASPPSPICLTARFCTATVSAPNNWSSRARSTG
jgi:hypothetical protein